MPPRGLSLRTFNIRGRRGFRITQAIWEARISGFNLMIMTETNITEQAYCCNRMGYGVVCLQAITMSACDAKGGVGLFIQD